MLQLSMKIDDLKGYVIKQLNNFFPDELNPIHDGLFNRAFDSTMDRVYYCFKHVNMPAYNKDGRTYFSHLHSDQYTMFLWFLSNSLWKEYEDTIYAQKVFYLNRALNSFLCMYDAELPNIFLILHGIGTTLGKAKYSDFLVCCQGVTVGARHGIYPEIGRGVSLLPNASIIGNTIIGGGVSIAANCMVVDEKVESHSVIYNELGIRVQKEKKVPWAQNYFSVKVL